MLRGRDMVQQLVGIRPNWPPRAPREHYRNSAAPPPSRIGDEQRPTWEHQAANDETGVFLIPFYYTPLALF